MDVSRFLPELNVDVFEHLFVVETVLRELVIDELAAVAGPQWWKQRIPNYKPHLARRDQTESKTAWTQLVPHHPVYYTDFPDLRQIIQKSDNWRDAFKGIFVNDSVVVGLLESLEPVRNKVAHNRKVTQCDAELVRGVVAAVSAAVGEARFAVLAHRCTAEPDLLERIGEIRADIVASRETCRRARPLPATPALDSCLRHWWFDTDYLAFDVTAVALSSRLCGAYRELPRPRGCGPAILRWCVENDVDAAMEAAMAAIPQ